MFVVNFNQRVSLGLPKDVPFTSDVPRLLHALSRTPAVGNTALYDGVAVALDHVKTGTGSRKALIVISDGGDNASNLGFQTLLEQAKASNAQIYTIGVFDEDFAGQDLAVLKRLAKVTGGQAYFPQSVPQIPNDLPADRPQPSESVHHRNTIPQIQSREGSIISIRVTARALSNGRRLHVSNSLRLSSAGGSANRWPANGAPHVRRNVVLKGFVTGWNARWSRTQFVTGTFSIDRWNFHRKWPRLRRMNAPGITPRSDKKLRKIPMWLGPLSRRLRSGA